MSKRSEGRTRGVRLEPQGPRATISPAAALVPLRFFLGGTFLYAGLDKLLTPSFFVAGMPGSIQEQLIAFARHSPLAGLIVLFQPWAVALGVAIAVTEIAVGLGTLSGYGFRVAAATGAALSVLFWLTASWATQPYYYGPDLPYAAGWITLALAGHGGTLVSGRFLRPIESPASHFRKRHGSHPEATVGDGSTSSLVVGRRAILEAGVLGTAAIVVGSLALPLRGILNPGGATAGGRETGSGDPGRSPSPTSTPPVTLPPGIAVAVLADVQRTGATAFTVPFNAPAPLPAGDPGVIVRLADGSFVAYDATCPHAGCTVEWEGTDDLLICPCHGAAFDPAQHGRVLDGPTDQPLTVLPLVLDPASGTFLLRTS